MSDSDLRIFLPVIILMPIKKRINSGQSMGMLKIDQEKWLFDIHNSRFSFKTKEESESLYCIPDRFYDFIFCHELREEPDHGEDIRGNG